MIKSAKTDCIRFNLFDTDNLIYNENNEMMEKTKNKEDPLQELAFSKYHISMILKCRGIWIVEEAYGLSWDIYQIKLFKPKIELPIGCQFLRH